MFLGYNVQVGHVWRGEYLVAKLEGLDEKIKENNLMVLRTKRIAFPDGDFILPLAEGLPVVDSDLDFRMSLQGKPDDDQDDGYDPSDDEDGDSPPPGGPPGPGHISEGDLQRMTDERHERDQSFYQQDSHPKSESLQVHPLSEHMTEELIRADSVADEKAEGIDQGGGKASSSSSKARSPDVDKRDPKFDVFVDYDLDPNKMPNGKPTPKGYVWDRVLERWLTLRGSQDIHQIYGWGLAPQQELASGRSINRGGEPFLSTSYAHC